MTITSVPRLPYRPTFPSYALAGRLFGHDIYSTRRGYTADSPRQGYPQSWEDLRYTLRRQAGREPRPLPSFAQQLAGEQKAAIINHLRATRTLSDCLRDPAIRALLTEAARDGKAWTSALDAYTTRTIQREGIAFMSSRLTRRADRAVSSAVPATGRISTLAATRNAARDAAAAARLRSRLDSLIRPLVRGLYRTATAGDHTLSIRVGDPIATGESSKGDRYSKRCTWRRTDSHHTITVPSRWKSRVYDRGLSVIGGHFVLDAEKVRGRAGQYDVVLVTQEAGFAIGTRRCRVLIVDEFAPQGDDDRVQVRLPIVIASSDEGVVVTDESGRVCQVVVKCSTTGTRHQLTVPPKFGRPLGKESEADRVRAALAWTFGLKPDQYRVAVAS